MNLPNLHCLALLVTCLLPAAAQAGPITALAFSPDSTALLSNGPRAILVRHPTNAIPHQRWECPLPKITVLRFSPDGHTLAAAGGTPGERGEVRLLAWPKGTLLSGWVTGDDLVTALEFSPTGTRLVTSGADGRTRIWSLPTPTTSPPIPQPPKAALVELSGHAGPVHAVAWSPLDDGIVTAGADRALKVWSPETGQLRRTFSQHSEPPHTLAFQPRPLSPSPTSPLLCASGAEDHTVRLWQPAPGRMVRIVRRHQGAILALAWKPDGSSLFSAGTEGVVRQIDAQSDAILAEWTLTQDWILSLAFAPDGSRLAAGDASGNIHFVRW